VSFGKPTFSQTIGKREEIGSVEGISNAPIY